MMKQLRITLSMSQNLTGDLILRGNPTLNAYSKLIPELWRQVLMNLRPLDDVLEEIWSPVIKNARGLVFRIVNMTQDLGLVVSAEKNFAPKLFYITRTANTADGWQDLLQRAMLFNREKSNCNLLCLEHIKVSCAFTMA